MAGRVLTDEQKSELQSGDGYYYVTQGMAGHAGEWPDVVRHPKSKMLRLVKRQVPVHVVKIKTEAEKRAELRELDHDSL